jgi:hypothetical protein
MTQIKSKVQVSESGHSLVPPSLVPRSPREHLATLHLLGEADGASPDESLQRRWWV